MAKTITKEQLEELEEAYLFYNREDWFDMLEEYVGIVANPYTTYAFYDEADNYVGDSNDYTIRDLLESACVKVVE